MESRTNKQATGTAGSDHSFLDQAVVYYEECEALNENIKISIKKGEAIAITDPVLAHMKAIYETAAPRRQTKPLRVGPGGTYLGC